MGTPINFDVISDCEKYFDAIWCKWDSFNVYVAQAIYQVVWLILLLDINHILSCLYVGYMGLLEKFMSLREGVVHWIRYFCRVFCF